MKHVAMICEALYLATCWLLWGRVGLIIGAIGVIIGILSAGYPRLIAAWRDFVDGDRRP